MFLFDNELRHKEERWFNFTFCFISLKWMFSENILNSSLLLFTFWNFRQFFFAKSIFQISKWTFHPIFLPNLKNWCFIRSFWTEHQFLIRLLILLNVITKAKSVFKSSSSYYKMRGRILRHVFRRILSNYWPWTLQVWRISK